MLILAGVSLNAIIGDNGIITNAQNANYQNQKAILQEYFDQFYVEHFEEFGDEANKALILQSLNASKNWIYKGKLGYVVDEKGYVHYFLIIENMPKEIKENIKIGIGEKNYSDYANCWDVWGITEDLKVYYCSDGLDSIDGVTLANLGKENGKDTALPADSSLARLISGSDTSSISKSDLKGISTLTIDSNSGVENFNEFYKFTGLTDLTLKDLELQNLDGIEYLAKLKRIYFINCKIGDYSKLSELRKQLQHIYFQLATNDEIKNFCSSELGVGGVDFPNLAYFGIYGNVHFIEDYSYNDRYGYAALESYVYHSSFSNVSYLSNLSDSTKARITNLFLNNNSISNIDNLYEFSGVTTLRIEGNYLTNLKGLYSIDETDSTKSKGMKSLKDLLAYNNKLGEEVESGEISGTISASTDGLTFLSKTSFDETSGKYLFATYFDELQQLDVGQNKIKNLNYISGNSDELLTLKIDDNPLINLDFGFQSIMSIVEKSGFSLKCDEYVTTYLEENSKKSPTVSLANKEMTVSEFESYLSGRQDYLKKLDLRGLTLTSSGTQLTNLTTPTYSKALNDTLTSFSEMYTINLNGLTDVYSINFTSGMTKLAQIDLRGTNVTDLSNLVDITNFRCLLIDNPNIKVVNEPDATGKRPITDVERLFNKIKLGINTFTLSYYFYDAHGRGVLLCNKSLVGQLAYSTNINQFCIAYQGNVNVFEGEDITYDLRNSQVDYFYCMHAGTTGTAKFLFPTTIEKALFQNGGSGHQGIGAECYQNLNNLTYLQGFNFSWSDFMNMAVVCPNLEEIDFYTAGYVASCDFGKYIEKNESDEGYFLCPEKLKRLSFYSYSGNMNNGFGNTLAKVFGKFTNLEYLYLGYLKDVTDFSFLDNLTKLEELKITFTGLSTLCFVENMEYLTKLTVTYNSSLEKDGFDFEGNPVDNLEILKTAFDNGLRTAYIRNCSITKEEVEAIGLQQLAWTKFEYISI